MIELYTWSTPNGRKVSIALEELGLEYNTHSINIMEDEQFAPDFLKIAPNNRIPAIVDTDTGQSLMESGAILLYLAEKTGQLMPKDAEGRWRTIEWLMWQMGGPGPMLGQAHHFIHFNPDKSEYAAERYRNEGKRLTACSTGASRAATSSPETIRSRISPFGPGSRGSSGKLLI